MKNHVIAIKMTKISLSILLVWYGKSDFTSKNIHWYNLFQEKSSKVEIYNTREKSHILLPGNMNKGGFKIIYNSEKLEITHLSAGE